MQNNTKPDYQVKIFKGGGVSLKDLIKDESERFAEFISKNNKDTYTQVRRFYDELVRIKYLYNMNMSKGFEKYLPSIYIIASKALYANKRNTLSKYFSNFIYENVRKIETADDLENFILYFESVLGYLKYYIEIENEKKREAKKQKEKQYKK